MPSKIMADKINKCSIRHVYAQKSRLMGWTNKWTIGWLYPESWNKSLFMFIFINLSLPGLSVIWKKNTVYNWRKRWNDGELLLTKFHCEIFLVIYRTLNDIAPSYIEEAIQLYTPPLSLRWSSCNLLTPAKTKLFPYGRDGVPIAFHLKLPVTWFF